MIKLTDLQVDYYIAAQQPVVKDQVDKKVIFVKSEALLTSLKEKAFSQFQEKMFEFVDYSVFQILFGILSLFFESEKFQHIGFLEQILRPGDALALH
jgi:hypothetical protein